ncbi:tetratricopeptide repeat protein [Rufibacter roseus]|uniref:Tetratricopeptide repeat protein n=1 Tax=Rufibacter roseus TaxID=1567108 RepID=A0ABW2DTV3_9BACT|nr:tetratricopeptide repeat protein [Rufibacter roseus]
MRKFLLTAFAAVSMQAAFAQNSAVTSAAMYQQKGTLDKAKTEIDKAVVHEKTKDNPKAWYTKGLIYQGLAVHPIYSKTIDPAKVTQEAYDAFQKAVELEKDAKKKQYTELSNLQFDQLKQNLYVYALNKGVEEYNNKNFAEAKNAYLEAIKHRPEDTTAYIYAAYAAAGAEDYAGAKQLYNTLVDKKMASSEVYGQLLYIATEVEKSDEEALKVLTKARAAFPQDRNFMLQELSLFLKTGKEEEAMSKLDAAIKADPTNANLYTVRGNMNERLKKQDQAIADYKKAIELDPSSFDAQYNMGVYYYNQGINLKNRAEKMSLAQYQKNGKALETEANKFFTQALPFFESALNAKPKDVTTIKSLNKVYNALGRKADANRMDTLLQEL